MGSLVDHPANASLVITEVEDIGFDVMCAVGGGGDVEVGTEGTECAWSSRVAQGVLGTEEDDIVDIRLAGARCAAGHQGEGRVCAAELTAQLVDLNPIGINNIIIDIGEGDGLGGRAGDDDVMEDWVNDIFGEVQFGHNAFALDLPIFAEAVELSSEGVT